MEELSQRGRALTGSVLCSGRGGGVMWGGLAGDVGATVGAGRDCRRFHLRKKNT